MSLHRRQLPIASPCERFEGTEATADRAAFCTRCDKQVHDLSRLTEPQVVDLLARHVGREVCVSYRTRPDGTIALRKPLSRVAPAAMALSMVACAGHLGEADTRASDCVDASGYHIECPPTARLDMAVIPDDTAAVDPAQLEPPEATVEELELTDFADMPTTRGGVGGTLIEGPAVPGPVPAVELVADDEPFMGAMMRVDDGPLSRKVQRQAKRIERRDRREQRALAKR